MDSWKAAVTAAGRALMGGCCDLCGPQLIQACRSYGLRIVCGERMLKEDIRPYTVLDMP